MQLYGVASCTTVRRARAWLAARGVDAPFHDFKKAGVPQAELAQWLDAFGWERLLNRTGTTWRGLDAQQRSAVVDRTSAERLMRAAPSVIKRPIVHWDDGSLSLGFDADGWAARLAARTAR